MVLRRHSSVTTKGQVTIPKDIRDELGVRPHDRVMFIVENGTVRVERAESVIARTAGIAKGLLPFMTAEELRSYAEEAMAEDAMRRGLAE